MSLKWDLCTKLGLVKAAIALLGRPTSFPLGHGGSEKACLSCGPSWEKEMFFHLQADVELELAHWVVNSS